MRRRETKEIDIENITSEPRKRVQSLEGVMSLLTGGTKSLEFSVSNEAKKEKKGFSGENLKSNVNRKAILKSKEQKLQKKTTVKNNKKEKKIKRPAKTKIRLSKKQRREFRMNIIMTINHLFV